VQQLRLDTERTSIVAFLVVFAFSSLGFAVLGLILGPDHKLGQEHRPELEVQILRPDSPQLDPLVEFWEEAGFHLFKREASYILQPYPRIQENSVWMQGPGRVGSGAPKPGTGSGIIPLSALQWLSAGGLGAAD
jgi:hypothetical protein